ncbi:DUF948 domain-containing protein [Sporosarcina sp. BI001-red]|uniref:DUF948 domain-containing protein n=1 Tax=Sporosarcina sp. BI001-red TaxID=2282866 RepID=UPI000E279BF5|nr:DUF948 domain-containing protein [Sporosarcina sp. BI001-red]REB07407.1 DUF948 domain-containing protein [Sporosarcina sp. BI001-red]
MEILLYVSAAIAALSLLLIAIFVIITLKSAKATMNEVSETLTSMQGKLNGITDQANELLANTNRITGDVERKMQSLNSVSKTAEKLDDSTVHINKSFQSLSEQISNPDPKYKDLMQKANTITGIAASIYFRAKREKSKQTNASYSARQDKPHTERMDLLPSPQKRLPEPKQKN